MSFIPMHKRFVESAAEPVQSGETLDPLSADAPRLGIPDPDEVLRCARLSREVALGAAARWIVALLLAPVRPMVERLCASRRRERAAAELMAVDDRTLADLGISRADIPFIVNESVREPSDPYLEFLNRR